MTKEKKLKKTLKYSRTKYTPYIIMASDLSINPKDMVKFKNFGDLIKFHKKDFKKVPLVEFEGTLYLIMADVVYYAIIPKEESEK